jgi:zinc-finger of a C2HC-type
MLRSSGISSEYEVSSKTKTTESDDENMNMSSLLGQFDMTDLNSEMSRILSSLGPGLQDTTTTAAAATTTTPGVVSTTNTREEYEYTDDFDEYSGGDSNSYSGTQMNSRQAAAASNTNNSRFPANFVNIDSSACSNTASYIQHPSTALYDASKYESSENEDEEINSAHHLPKNSYFETDAEYYYDYDGNNDADADESQSRAVMDEFDGLATADFLNGAAGIELFDRRGPVSTNTQRHGNMKKYDDDGGDDGDDGDSYIADATRSQSQMNTHTPHQHASTTPHLKAEFNFSSSGRQSRQRSNNTKASTAAAPPYAVIDRRYGQASQGGTSKHEQSPPSNNNSGPQDEKAVAERSFHHEHPKQHHWKKQGPQESGHHRRSSSEQRPPTATHTAPTQHFQMAASMNTDEEDSDWIHQVWSGNVATVGVPVFETLDQDDGYSSRPGTVGEQSVNASSSAVLSAMAPGGASSFFRQHHDRTMELRPEHIRDLQDHISVPYPDNGDTVASSPRSTAGQMQPPTPRRSDGGISPSVQIEQDILPERMGTADFFDFHQRQAQFSSTGDLADLDIFGTPATLDGDADDVAALWAQSVRAIHRERNMGSHGPTISPPTPRRVNSDQFDPKNQHVKHDPHNVERYDRGDDEPVFIQDTLQQIASQISQHDTISDVNAHVHEPEQQQHTHSTQDQEQELERRQQQQRQNLQCEQQHLREQEIELERQEQERRRQQEQEAKLQHKLQQEAEQQRRQEQLVIQQQQRQQQQQQQQQQMMLQRQQHSHAQQHHVDNSAVQRVACEKCGRNVRANALKMHQKTCKPRRTPSAPLYRSNSHGVQRSTSAHSRVSSLSEISAPDSMYSRPNQIARELASPDPVRNAFVEQHPDGGYSSKFSSSSGPGYSPRANDRSRASSPPVPAVRNKSRKLRGVPGGGDSSPNVLAAHISANHMATLTPCSHCGRTFHPDRLPKHEAACERVFLERRKPLSAAKARVRGAGVYLHGGVLDVFCCSFCAREFPEDRQCHNHENVCRKNPMRASISKPLNTRDKSLDDVPARVVTRRKSAVSARPRRGSAASTASAKSTTSSTTTSFSPSPGSKPSVKKVSPYRARSRQPSKHTAASTPNSPAPHSPAPDSAPGHGRSRSRSRRKSSPGARAASTSRVPSKRGQSANRQRKRQGSAISNASNRRIVSVSALHGNGQDHQLLDESDNEDADHGDSPARTRAHQKRPVVHAQCPRCKTDGIRGKNCPSCARMIPLHAPKPTCKLCGALRTGGSACNVCGSTYARMEEPKIGKAKGKGRGAGHGVGHGHGRHDSKEDDLEATRRPKHGYGHSSYEDMLSVSKHASGAHDTAFDELYSVNAYPSHTSAVSSTKKRKPRVVEVDNITGYDDDEDTDISVDGDLDEQFDHWMNSNDHPAFDQVPPSSQHTDTRRPSTTSSTSLLRSHSRGRSINTGAASQTTGPPRRRSNAGRARSPDFPLGRAASVRRPSTQASKFKTLPRSFKRTASASTRRPSHESHDDNGAHRRLNSTWKGSDGRRVSLAEQVHQYQASNNRIECPHCSRKFSVQASERHIQVCANVRSKPGRIQRGTTSLAYMNTKASSSSPSSPKTPY